MTNGNSAEREAFELAMGGYKTGDAWVIWQKAWRAALSVCADGGKGEAVYQVLSDNVHAWIDVRKFSYDQHEGHKRIVYTAPQAECAPRVDAKPCTCHPDDNPPKPCAQKYALNECRAAAEKDAALTKITQNMLNRVQYFRNRGLSFVSGGTVADELSFFARAILAASKEPQP